eukprot:TRINITY_DN607_c1_g1_i1.p1 TRINITY_DN607_c1_g1~~TRINITY_DN607_c1_g1_i1.p1  ORF type:complete len:234 (+),score=58.72 TRINITY_DN607_c1_g1_i1:46-747(+)
METLLPLSPKAWLALPACVAGGCLVDYALGWGAQSRAQSKGDLKTMQRGIASTVLPGAVLCAAVFGAAEQLVDLTTSGLLRGDVATAGDRVGVVARLAAAPALTLLYAINKIASQRGSNPSLVTGTPDAGGASAFDIDQRCLTNTHQQVVLHLAANVAYAAFGALEDTPAAHTASLAVPFLNTMLFVAGRIAFFYGYTSDPGNPARRGFGFCLTFAPSVLTLLWTAYRFISEV